jgi:uncharacterized protein (DUF1800 family)
MSFGLKSPPWRLLMLLIGQALGCSSAHQPPVRPDPTVSSGLSITVPATSWSVHQQAIHVLNRLAYGPSPADLRAVEQMGVAAWIERQLRPDWISDEAVSAKLRGFPTLAQSTTELHARFPPLKLQAHLAGIDTASPDAREALQAIPREDLPRQIVIELLGAKLVRAVESNRQLQEVLVDFWFNHFNVSVEKGQVKWMVTSYEKDAIRPHLFGNFRELLAATAHHPAMLFYLDNWLSKRDGLNENYARELLELHTVGVNGGYTQADVREVARCFTGWSINMPRFIGDFTYRHPAHDPGAKVVLGVQIPAGGGQEDGERVLDLLATHPSTARFLATKLIRKFVSDQPPPELVERLASVFLKTDGHLGSVYAALFSSPEFWSDQAYASKTKTPLKFAVSAVRALGGSTTGDVALVHQIDRMGEPLYRSQPPTGFPEAAEAWVNAGEVVNRINFGLALAANRIRGTRVEVGQYLKGSPQGEEAMLEALGAVILGVPPDASAREALRQAVSEATGKAPSAPRRAANSQLIAGLLLGSPQFQKQ